MSSSNDLWSASGLAKPLTRNRAHPADWMWPQLRTYGEIMGPVEGQEWLSQERCVYSPLCGRETAGNPGSSIALDDRHEESLQSSRKQGLLYIWLYRFSYQMVLTYVGTIEWLVQIRLAKNLGDDQWSSFSFSPGIPHFWTGTVSHLRRQIKSSQRMKAQPLQKKNSPASWSGGLFLVGHRLFEPPFLFHVVLVPQLSAA